MAEVTRATQAGLQAVGLGSPGARATQAGLVVVGLGNAANRATQAGLVVVGEGTPGNRATQAGLSILSDDRFHKLRAEATDQNEILLYMMKAGTEGAGSGVETYTVHRSETPDFTPGPGNQFDTVLLASPGPFWYEYYVNDSIGANLQPGTTYYFALGAVVDGLQYYARDAATTVGLRAPTLRVGAIGISTATLSVDPLSAFIDINFETYRDAVLVDSVTNTGPGTPRHEHTVEGLTPSTDYWSRARVRYAAGWSGWSNIVEFTTFPFDWDDDGFLACPPQFPGPYVNPDANPPTNRYGLGWFHPFPGEPMRGNAAELVFRYWTSGPIWDVYISDDAGATWTPLFPAWNADTGFDGDILIRYTATLDTTGYPDGVNYRLKAVSTNTADDDVISLTFAIDNDEAVYSWHAAYGDLGDRWAKLWSQVGRRISGAYTTDGIWRHGRDGGIGALFGHDPAALVDRTIPRCLGGDVTIRFYIWSGEGGHFAAQGRDDTEALTAGIGFFVDGDGPDNARGMWVGVANPLSTLVGCCNDSLTSNTATVNQSFAMISGAGFFPADIGAAIADDAILKMWFKCLRRPRYEKSTGVWPLARYRNGPEPGDDLFLVQNTCARRWEQYSLRVRAELDPGDHKRVRVRSRIDGMGVQEPAAGYWHSDDWNDHPVEFEPGQLSLMSFQLAQELYGNASGARVFYSWSALPLFPEDEPPEIPPFQLPPWNQTIEGEPCTLILQVFREDREFVRWEVGTDTLHPNPYLMTPEHYGEQEIDVVAGAATIGQVEVIVVDRSQTEGDQDSGWLTERLSIGSVGGLHGRRCRLIRFISPALGWVVIADGPASTPEMDGSYAAYRWVIRDTRETERKVKAFPTTDTCWLIPAGVQDGFGRYDDEDGNGQWLVSPAEPLVGDYTYDDTQPYPTGNVTFYDYWPGPFLGGAPVGIQTVPDEVVVLPSVEERLIADAEELGSPLPVYWTWPDLEILWRPSGSGAAWTVVDPTDTLVPGRSLAKPTGAGQWWRKKGVVWDAELADGTAVRAITVLGIRGYLAEGLFPEDGTEIEVALKYKGPPTEDFPQHIEGLSPGQFLKNGYDGVYSRPDPLTGEPVPTGIRYNELDLLAMGAPTEPARFILGDGSGFLLLEDGGYLLLEVGSSSDYSILLRQTEPIDDFREWAEEHIYSPIGWCPALNNDGEISPKSQIPPDTLDGLTNITNAVTEPQPDWDAGERIINVLTYNYPRWYPVEIGDTNAVDLLEEREVTQQWRDEASITRHALQEQTYDGDAYSAIGDISGKPIVSLEVEQGTILTELRRLYVFDRYRNGAATIQVPVRRLHVATLRAGDWVVVDLSWFPDYLTKERGLLTSGQILAIHDVDCEWRILLIEEALPVFEVS